MCLISIAGVGLNKYSEEFKEAVKNGVYSQTDGTGFAYWKHGSRIVNFEKGFLPSNNNKYGIYNYPSKDSLLENFNKVWDTLVGLKLADDDILVIHHRTSTGGTEDEENCHPFILSPSTKTSIKDIVKVGGSTTNGVLFHNGIFGIKTPDHRYNDTAHLTHKLFSGCPENINLLKRDAEKFDELYKNEIKYNKVVVLFPGFLRYLGSKLTETISGYLHSNDSYKTADTDTGGSTYKGLYGSNYKRSYSDEEEAYWENYAVKTRVNDIEYPKRTYKPVVDIIEFNEKTAKPFVLADFIASMDKIEYPKEAETVYTGSTIENQDTPDNLIKQLLDLDRDFFNKELQYLLCVDKKYANHMFFVSKQAFGDYPAGTKYIAHDFDFASPTSVTLSTYRESKALTRVLSPSKCFENYYVVPRNIVFRRYYAYLKLAKIEKERVFDPKVMSYLKKLASMTSLSGIIKIKKPVKIKLDIEGVRMFVKIKALEESPFKNEWPEKDKAPLALLV